MDLVKIDMLAERLLQKRAGTGLRLAAKEVGISPSTLSRVENGKIPDLETFGRICAWLGDDPAVYLGLQKKTTPTMAQVHLKKGTTIERESAYALGEMLLLAQKALLAEDSF
jgi:transcriptional regulator with XRE-family HTH domain